jgi:hypothetical protein
LPAFFAGNVKFGQLDLSHFGVHMMSSVFVATDTLISRNSDVLIRFLRAVIGGWEAFIVISRRASLRYWAYCQNALEQQREFVLPSRNSAALFGLGAPALAKSRPISGANCKNSNAKIHKLKGRLNLFYAILNEAYRSLR